MKYTPEKIVPLAILTTFFLIIIAGILTVKGSSDYEESVQEYAALSGQAKEIESVKTRWSHEASQNDLTYLKNHPSLTKEEKRGGSVYLEFNNLSSSEFNALSNKLLNSMLVIKKLTLQRNNASKGIITVEFES
ncbi:MAG: hypothetical protein Q8R86_11005 [Sulfuricurvum sp.]|nr:hypothetical protein [Sulfuricurvum sp.]